METKNQNIETKIQVKEYKDYFKVTRYADQVFPAKTILLRDEAEGVRNFFQMKRDLALGRWRDPVDPDMVCYPIDDRALVDVRVLDERTGVSYSHSRDSARNQKFDPSFKTAGRYYAAHPIIRPWEEAKEGEYWLVIWSHSPILEPCTVVQVENELFFKGMSQCRALSSRYIEHAQRLITEDN